MAQNIWKQTRIVQKKSELWKEVRFFFSFFPKTSDFLKSLFYKEKKSMREKSLEKKIFSFFTNLLFRFFF